MIKIKVKPGSKHSLLEKTEAGENEYSASIKADTEHGEANRELINLIAKEFGVHFSRVKIKNPSSRKKIIEILD